MFVATNSKDGQGLKPIAASITKNLLWLALPDETCLISSSELYTSILCMGKDTKQWLQHRTDLKQQYPPERVPLSWRCFQKTNLKPARDIAASKRAWFSPSANLFSSSVLPMALEAWHICLKSSSKRRIHLIILPTTHKKKMYSRADRQSRSY